MAQTDRLKYMTEDSMLRADVWDASDKHCAYCGVELHPLRTFCVDHVIPKCAGGSDEMSNLVAACRACNNTKGATSDRDLCARISHRWRGVIDGRKVRQIRDGMGLTRHAMERNGCVSSGTIALIERHESRIVMESTALKIAKALGVEVDVIFTPEQGVEPKELLRDE